MEKERAREATVPQIERKIAGLWLVRLLRKWWTIIAFIISITVNTIVLLRQSAQSAGNTDGTLAHILTMLVSLTAFTVLNQLFNKMDVEDAKEEIESKTQEHKIAMEIQEKDHRNLLTRYYTLSTQYQDILGQTDPTEVDYFPADPSDESYYRLLELFKKTNTIRAVSPASIGGNFANPREEARVRYYGDITDGLISAMQIGGRKLTYHRIYQTDISADKPLLESHGVTVFNHCKNVLEAKKELGSEINEECNVAFSIVQTARGVGYVIYDEESVVIILDGYEEEGRVNHAGYLYIRHKKTVSRFIKLFKELDTNGSPLTLSKLNKCQNSNFEGMDLTDANLTYVNLTNANLKKAQLEGAQCDKNTILPDKTPYNITGGLEQFQRFTDPNSKDFWQWKETGDKK
jgi:Pentapeptide repeats (8 copies)